MTPAEASYALSPVLRVPRLAAVRLRRPTAIFLVLVLLLLGGLGLALARVERAAEAQLLDRFATRNELGARFMTSYISDLQEREIAFAEHALLKAPTEAKVESALVGLGMERAVVLRRGRLISGFPFDRALMGKDLAAEYSHLAAATDGRRATSAVVPAAVGGTPVVAFAVPYGPPEERRVFSGGNAIGQSPIGADYLQNLMPIRTTDVYLLDDSGLLISSSDPAAENMSLKEASPALASALSQGSGGSFSVGDTKYRFASARVEGAPWTLVSSVRSDLLLKPLAESSHKAPWLLLLGLTISAGAGLLLIHRLDQKKNEIATANATIEASAAQLRRTNEELEQFAYVASHDLQEPLRMVSSYVQLLERRYSDQLDDDAREFIGFASDGATRMQKLIQDLLAYARVHSKGKDFTFIEAMPAAERAVANLQHAIEDAGAEVLISPLPSVAADPSQLVQLFQNLVGNAIKYRSPDRAPRVEVSAQREGSTWLFSVKDNGIGIDAKYADRIFVVFQRLHKRTEYDGTGIGLSICKRIVERHGGEIRVESQAGHGSTFLFTMPGDGPGERGEELDG